MSDPVDYRQMLLQLCGSLTLCDHMGDVSNDVLEVLTRLGMPESVLNAEWEEVGKELGKLGVTTLYGTKLYHEDEGEDA